MWSQKVEQMLQAEVEAAAAKERQIQEEKLAKLREAEEMKVSEQANFEELTREENFIRKKRQEISDDEIKMLKLKEKSRSNSSMTRPPRRLPGL